MITKEELKTDIRVLQENFNRAWLEISNLRTEIYTELGKMRLFNRIAELEKENEELKKKSK